MSALSQPPRDFMMQNTQQNPVRQYRPNFTDAVPREIQEAFRQTFDNIQSQRTAFSPYMLYGQGTSTSVTVPATAGGFGVEVSLDRSGTWVLAANACVHIVSDSNQLFHLTLQVGDTSQSLQGQFEVSGDSILMVGQSWQVLVNLPVAPPGKPVPQSQVVKCRLLIQKDGGGGTSFVDATNSTLTATWQGT